MVNLIYFPILVMILFSIFAASTNQVNSVIINGSPVSLAQAITVCQSSQLDCSNITQNNPNLTCGWSVWCNLLCFFYGNLSPQCINQKIAETLAISIGQGLQNKQSSTGSFVFSFNPSSSNGWISLLIVASAAIVIVGFTVLGTGLNAASIYIAFILGIYIAIWTVLSTLSAPTFAGFPNITDSNGFTIQTGTTLWSFLSLMYTVGVAQRLA